MFVHPLALAALAFPAGLPAQARVQTVTGVVLELGGTGRPIVGADVLIGPRGTTTNERGAFRMDSLPPGRHPLTVRRIGYRPLRGNVPVVLEQPTELELYMVPAPHLLPTLIAEGPRRGIFGVVGDTGLRPLPGAKVTLLGPGGRDRLTDSLGRFEFPEAVGGTYVLRVALAGYQERRHQVELPKGEGRELSFKLGEQALQQRFSPGENAALWDLGRRLVFELKRSRMTSAELERYGAMSLCDVPRVRAHSMDPATVVVNGITLLREVSLCAWRTDEVDLVEFCSEMRSCAVPYEGLRPVTSSRRGRSRTPRGGQGTVVIWEKR